MLPLSPDSQSKLNKLIEQDEGFRQFPYHDTKNKLTIGFGFNLESDGLPRAVAEFWLDYKLDAIQSELRATLEIFQHLDEIRRLVLIDIAFNCGVAGLMGFRRMIAALQSGDYTEAAKEIIDSELAPNRKERLAYFMETGEINL